MALVVENARPWFCARNAFADVVDHERPTDARYVADDVEKKSRVFFHASADVVDHARPTEAKYAALVVEKKLVVLFQKSALVVENELAMR